MPKRDGSGLMYRTPADVRAIPNERWEERLATDSVPFPRFAASRETQTTLRHVLNATLRRMGSR